MKYTAQIFTLLVSWTCFLIWEYFTGVWAENQAPGGGAIIRVDLFIILPMLLLISIWSIAGIIKKPKNTNKMTKKHVVKVVLLLFMSKASFSQTSTNAFVQLGFNYNSFQDTKFSKVIYTGPGLMLHLGYAKETDKSIFGAGLNANGSFEFASTHEQGFTNSLFPRAYTKYQRKLNENVGLGLHWDVLSLNYRGVSGLMNNGKYYQTASDLLLSGSLKKGKLSLGMDVGFLSLIKEGAGFAFTAPQSALEKGDFDYQNEALSNPLNLSTADWRTLNKRKVFLSTIEWKPKNKMSVAYHWEFRQITNVPQLSATNGRHTIAFKYHFLNKH